MLARDHARTVHLRLHGPVQDVLHEGRLARPADPRHADERAQGEVDADVLQVVLPGAFDPNLPVADGTPLVRHRDRTPPAQVGAREGGALPEEPRKRARVHDVAAELAGARSDIDHVVGRLDGRFVVFDHDQRVAEVAQPDQRVDQPPVVPLVQADRRFVQDVQHAGQPAADLGGQADPLSFPARQRPAGPVEREVVQTDVHQELQASPDLLQHAFGDELLPLGELQVAQEVELRADALGREVGDVQLTHGDGERFGLQPSPLAGSARDLPHVLLQAGPLAVGLALPVAPLDVRDDPFEGRGVGAEAAEAIAIRHLDRLARAVQDGLASPAAQLPPGGRRAHALGPGDRFEQPLPVAHPVARPRRDGAFIDREVLVRDDQLRVHLQPRAEPVAHRTCSVRRVEREVTRSELVEADVVERAGQLLAERDHVLAVLGLDGHRRQALRQLEGGLDRIGHPSADVGVRHQAVDHDVDVVLVVAVQADLLRELPDLAVDPGSGEAPSGQVLQEAFVLALPAPDDGGQDLEPRPFGELHDLVDDLVGGLAADRTAALRTVRVADPGVQDAQVVVDLSDGPDRASWVS